ncbi:MAG TPA: hypothetical protein VF136_10190 [Methylomirabilota bacterium]
MPRLSPGRFRQQIAEGAPDPVVLLVGDDDHEKAALALALGEMVEPDLRAFNVERLYASDKAVTPAAVIEAARTLPMMAPRRVVVVLQAERLLNPKKRQAAADDDGGSLEPVLDYLASPSPTTALMFAFSAPEPGATGDVPIPRNLKIYKALEKAATIVSCSGLDGGKEPGRWIEEQAQRAGLTIERRAVARLLELTGRDPRALRAEVEKLLLFAAGAGQITQDHVAAIAGTPVHHGDDWALIRALERSDARGALKELQAALDHGGIPYKILGQIGYAVRTPPPRGRFPAARVPGAVDALFRTDLALKSSGGDPKVLLERLIVELCG